MSGWESGELSGVDPDDHQVPILGGVEEDPLIRARLSDAETRIDGLTFLTALFEEVQASQPGWAAAFAASSEELQRLADDATREHRAGPTRELDPETL